MAIKVLPEEYASDPERLARFEQKARPAAALNHPHIAAVFDVGAELLELFQWKNPDAVENDLRNSQHLQRLPEEVADIVVYCLNMSDTLGFDLAEAIVQKLEQNAAKYPPEKTSGSAKKYTDL